MTTTPKNNSPTDNAWLDEIMLKPAHWQADDYAKAKQAILSHIDTVYREAEKQGYIKGGIDAINRPYRGEV